MSADREPLARVLVRELAGIVAHHVGEGIREALWRRDAERRRQRKRWERLIEGAKQGKP